MRGLLVAVALALPACSSEPRTVTLDVTPGHEADAFSRAPAVTTVTVEIEDASGTPIAGATSSPGGTFALGEFPRDELVRVSVKGADLGGELRVQGRSVALVPGELASDTWPVFVQRVGEFARPPSAPPGSTSRMAT